MARMSTWIGLAALTFSLTGCVAQEKYNAIKLERDRLVEQLGSAQKEASTANASAAALQSQLDALMRAGGDSNALKTTLMQQIDLLRKQLDEARSQYDSAMQKMASMGGGPLPVELDSALKSFASQNPDLVEFDSARGLVKFKSDLTFALGSADLSSRAKEVIGRFAKILNSPAASKYELMVAGHTDSTPVSNPRTKAHHPDNWYLSAHRAIAVNAALMKDGVNPQRLEVAGFADERPVASNATVSGRAQNRRVEVLILPTTVRGSSDFSAAPRATRAHHAAPKHPMLNKDVELDHAPMLNK